MVGIMVRDEQGFAQNSLASAVWNFGEEIRLAVGHKFLHRLEIPRERFQALVPGLGSGRDWRSGPVSGGPVWRNMFGVAREFQNIPLRNAHVLEQFPDRVRHASRADASQFGGNAAECRLPI